MAVNNVENANAYEVADANPLQPDIEFDLPSDFDEEDMTEMDDGSVVFGAEAEAAELPPINETPHTANLVGYFDESSLSKLAKEDPAKAELVKLRFFAGLSTDDAADVLHVSRTTAKRHWAYARAWLLAELHDSEVIGKS